MTELVECRIKTESEGIGVNMTKFAMNYTSRLGVACI